MRPRRLGGFEDDHVAMGRVGATDVEDAAHPVEHVAVRRRQYSRPRPVRKDDGGGHAFVGPRLDDGDRSGLGADDRAERGPPQPTTEPSTEMTAGVDILNKAVNAAYADPKMRARLTDTGGEPLPGSPADFGKIFAGEIEKWGKVVKASGMKPQ